MLQSIQITESGLQACFYFFSAELLFNNLAANEKETPLH
jgi:hypothetical protein